MLQAVHKCRIIAPGKRSPIPVSEPEIGGREVAYVTDALRSGWVSSKGKYLNEFSVAFSRLIECSEAIPVSSGTSSLHLALHALGIGPGDEVLVPDLTFVAPANTVVQTGARPVFVDVDECSWCIDPAAAGNAITHNTRAIIAVHLFGQPADLAQLKILADRYGLFLIEDCAQAVGASFEGCRVGGAGTVGAFSFFGNKIITTGEGGMLTTNDPQLAARMRHLRDHGMLPTRRYYHDELGFNYRMTNLQAALGLAQLEQIDEFLHRRRSIHGWYSELLSSDERITVQQEMPNTTHVFWMNSLYLDRSFSRDSVMQQLSERGIETRPFFAPMHDLPHLEQFQTFGRHGTECAVTDHLSAKGLSLPSSSNLSEASVEYICESLLEILDSESARVR